MRRLYWIKEGLKVVAFIFIASALYTLFMAIMNTEDDVSGGFLRQGAIYFVIMGVMMSLLYNMGLHQTVIPLSLSFGGTRREAVLGVQLYRLTVLFFLLVGGAALLILLHMEFDALLFAIPIIIGVYLFFSGLGGLLGSFSNKLSKKALSVLSVITILVVANILIFLVMALDFGLNPSSTLGLPLLAIGILVYGICCVFEVRSIRRHYVR